jgi:hypothetical protein
MLTVNFCLAEIVAQSSLIGWLSLAGWVSIHYRDYS